MALDLNTTYYLALFNVHVRHKGNRWGGGGAIFNKFFPPKLSHNYKLLYLYNVILNIFKALSRHLYFHFRISEKKEKKKRAQNDSVQISLHFQVSRADISLPTKRPSSDWAYKRPDYFVVFERNSATRVQKGSVSFSLKKFRLKRVWGRGNRQAEGGKAAPSELDFRRGAVFPAWEKKRLPQEWNSVIEGGGISRIRGRTNNDACLRT